MFAVRFHGRGGQGVVTAAELLASAAFREGRYAQAFPSFGSERMGAPVTSFCRIGDRPIRTHEPITDPDALLIQDATLLHQADLFAGLKADGYILLNSARDFSKLGLAELTGRYRTGRLRTLPASNLAMKHLGRPLPGAPLLGGFAALTGVVSLDAVLAAIAERFAGQVAAGNAATTAAFEFLTAETAALAAVAAQAEEKADASVPAAVFWCLLF